MTTQIFGDFIEEFKSDGDYLKLGFSPGSIPLQRRWRTNGLSADFIADYLEVFFIGQPATNSDPTIPIPVRSRNAVKYIANELLENAM
ncbi:MAG TPA: ATP-binding protein, partial [Thioploca sp.]|nr:ATP-binding protein [Thioploca sp.]